MTRRAGHAVLLLLATPPFAFSKLLGLAASKQKVSEWYTPMARGSTILEQEGTMLADSMSQ